MLKSFTAFQLIVMGEICQKKRIFGIPDAYAAFYEEYQYAARQETIKELLDLDVVIMDFNGKYTLAEEYISIIETCCECERCLSVSIQKADGSILEHIFWYQNGELTEAQISNGYYYFMPTVACSIKERLVFSGMSCAFDYCTATLSRIDINRAKRAILNGKNNEAEEILKSTGIHSKVAELIYMGLTEKADFINLQHMCSCGENCLIENKAFLSGCGLILEVKEKQMNFRTYLEFTCISESSLNEGIFNLLNTFLCEEDI